MNTVEILRKAADLIDTNGWCQGWFYDSSSDKPRAESPVCAVGAIAVAAHGDPFPIACECLNEPCSNPAAVAEQAVLHCMGVRSLSVWQDEPARTAEEVITALRACADRLENPEPADFDIKCGGVLP